MKSDSYYSRLIVLTYLLAVRLFSLTAQQGPPPQFVTNGLIYSYPLQGNAVDQQGVGPTGVPLFGAFFTNISIAPWSKAAWFNGSGALIHVGKDDAHDADRVLTWSMWVWPSGLSEGIFLYDDDAQYAGDRWVGMHSDGTLYEEDNTFQGVSGFVTGTKLSPNVWNHVVFAGDLLHKSLYLNGVRVGTTNASLPEHAGKSEIVFGSGYLNSSPYIHYLNGAMAGVRIFNRALSDQEVSLLYGYESGPTTPRVAIATPKIDNGFLVGATISDPGVGYTNVPNAYVYGTGDGASLGVVVTNGYVVHLNVLNPGHGYGSFDTVIIIDPPAPEPPRMASANSTISGGSVTGVQITNFGSGYSEPPIVILIGGGGNGAQATAQVFHGRVVGVTITAPGSGYTSVPRVGFTPPGSSAILALEVSAVKVSMGVTIGSKYQLVSTSDFSVWNPVGDPFVATTNYYEQNVVVSESARYFALILVP